MLGFGMDDRNLDAEIFEGMMNSFPAQRCEDQQLIKHVILEDGSTLQVALTVMTTKGEILYGDDRELLKWLLKRSLETGEADVSWETLLEYLGPNPTASQKKAIFEAVLRIGVTGASLVHNDVWMNMNLVSGQWSHEPETTLVAAKDDDFQGEAELVFNTALLELMRSAHRPRLVKGPS